MALLDIVIPEGDPQQGILEIPIGGLAAPLDMTSEQGMLELVLNAGGGNTYSRSRVVNE